MAATVSLTSRFYRARSNFYKRQRVLFPSPAEVRLIQIMGGKVLTCNFFKHPQTGFPLVIIVSLGRVFRHEAISREVRVGSKYIDFGNDIRRGIEVDGREYHGDIVKQIERDEYFASYGWRVLHIEATALWREPSKVQRQVIDFLTS